MKQTPPLEALHHQLQIAEYARAQLSKGGLADYIVRSAVDCNDR